MSKTFCVACGARHEYTHVAPKFCHNCGYAMSGVARAANPGSAGLLEGETDADYFPELDSLDVEVDNGVGFQSFSLAELVKNPGAAPKRFSPKRVAEVSDLNSGGREKSDE